MHRRLGASVAYLMASLLGLALLFIPSLARAAQPRHGGEADLILPDLGSVEVLGMSGSRLLELGMIVAALGLVFGVVTLLQVKNLPTHKSMAEVSQIILGDLQNVPDHSGQVHHDAGGADRRDHHLVLRRSATHAGDQGRRDPRLQHRRHSGQLRRGLVRHPDQHLRQLAHGLRQLARHAVRRVRDSAQIRDEHRHAADQRRAAADADDLAVRPR